MQNLNSDELRQRLSNNTLNMNLLTAENDTIVKILAERGLKAVEQAAKEKSSKRCEETPLTTDDLKVGGWWCADVSEECRLALVGIGINTAVDFWDDNARARCALKRHYGSCVARSQMAVESDTLKQIHRIGNEFYWGAPSDQAD